MEISKIVFYRDNNNQTKTVVLYNDGTVENFSYSEGIEILLRYAKEKGYTKISELKSDENLKIWNNKTYKENINKLIDSNNNNTINNENNNNSINNNNNKNRRKKRKKLGIIGLLNLKIKTIKEKLASKLTRKKKVKKPNTTKQTKSKKDNPKPLKNRFNFLKRDKTKKKRKKRKKSILNALIGTLIAACIGTGAWIKRDITQKQQAFEKELQNDMNNEDNENEDKISNYDNIYEALYNANINTDKKKAISGIWKYILNYNCSVAKNHLGANSSTRLGLKWNEAVAQYLAYNNLSQQSINNIFDTYKFDSDVFIDAYKSGFDQEVLAHTVQVEPLNKSKIIKNSKGKKFYEKYETIVIYYNSNSKDKEKLEYAEKFYKELKKDFDFDKENTKDIEKYKLSIMPMIKAMDKMTSNLNLNNKLSKSEQEYFNKLSSANMIKSKFKNIESKLTAYQIANQALDEENHEISYKDLKKLAIKELKHEDAYQVANNSERNIRDHSDYKKNTSYTVASNDNTQTATNTSSSNSSEATPTKTKAKDKKEKLKAKKIKNESINDTDITTVENTDDENNKGDDYYYVAPDTNEDTNNDQENNNVVNDENVKDVTTDSTDAVESDTPLPYPNNEDNIQTTNSSENNDSLITVTYINPKGVSASENYEISNNVQNSNESVATQSTSEEISTDNYVKTYTR